MSFKSEVWVSAQHLELPDETMSQKFVRIYIMNNVSYTNR